MCGVGLRSRPSSLVTLVAILWTISAVAGCGSSASTNVVGPSDPKCSVAAANNAAQIPAAGGSGTITITTERECSWSAQASAAWISLRDASGQGPATVSYSVAANPAGTARRGAIAVGGGDVEILQAAAPCRYEVTPSSVDLSAAGGQVSASVTATPGCSWHVRSETAWVSDPIPSDGVGSTTVRLSVAPNTGALRTGTVTIGDVTLTVRQFGATSPVPSP